MQLLKHLTNLITFQLRRMLSVFLVLLCWLSANPTVESYGDLRFSAPQSMCRDNVTAKAGMTARLFCCLAVNNKGAEVRIASEIRKSHNVLTTIMRKNGKERAS